MAPKKVRCWDTTDPLYIAYHDEEWGVPVHDDRKLFGLYVKYVIR
jgi:DNA-3-methyladenine glycosylase I